MIARLALLGLTVSVAACGPPSPEALERICQDRARDAAGPRGSIGLGVGSGGVATDLNVSISSDFVRGRDPQQVYDDCIGQRVQVGANLSVEP